MSFHRACCCGDVQPPSDCCVPEGTIFSWHGLDAEVYFPGGDPPDWVYAIYPSFICGEWTSPVPGACISGPLHPEITSWSNSHLYGEDSVDPQPDDPCFDTINAKLILYDPNWAPIPLTETQCIDGFWEVKVGAHIHLDPRPCGYISGEAHRRITTWWRAPITDPAQPPDTGWVLHNHSVDADGTTLYEVRINSLGAFELNNAALCENLPSCDGIERPCNQCPPTLSMAVSQINIPLSSPCAFYTNAAIPTTCQGDATFWNDTGLGQAFPDSCPRDPCIDAFAQHGTAVGSIRCQGTEWVAGVVILHGHFPYFDFTPPGCQPVSLEIEWRQPLSPDDRCPPSGGWGEPVYANFGNTSMGSLTLADGVTARLDVN